MRAQGRHDHSPCLSVDRQHPLSSLFTGQSGVTPPNVNFEILRIWTLSAPKLLNSQNSPDYQGVSTARSILREIVIDPRTVMTSR